MRHVIQQLRDITPTEAAALVVVAVAALAALVDFVAWLSVP